MIAALCGRTLGNALESPNGIHNQASQHHNPESPHGASGLVGVGAQVCRTDCPLLQQLSAESAVITCLDWMSLLAVIELKYLSGRY